MLSDDKLHQILANNLNDVYDLTNIFDEIYGNNRPGFIDGYKKLKSSIISW